MARKRRRKPKPEPGPEPKPLWPDDRIATEARRIRWVAVAGAAQYAIPAVVVAVLRGEAPFRIPGYHIAIPIILACLSLLAYVLMPLFDGVLTIGEPRPTKARAALMMRCVLTNTIGLAALLVFFQSAELVWPGVIYALGIPGAAGIIRRIPAYQTVMERTARGGSAADA